MDRKKFGNKLKKHLNHSSFFDFDYSPKIGVIIFLNFRFEGMCLQYSFTYSTCPNEWYVSHIRKKEFYYIGKSISGIILNQLSILLEWA